MMLTPFFIFFYIGMVLSSNQLYLVKLGLFVLMYLLVWTVSKTLFDDRVMNVVPIGVYLATKVSYFGVVAESRNKTWLYSYPE